jgi:CAAX protease family protein
MTRSFDAKTPAQRGIAFAEFLFGTAIVIGHNVFKVIPNEVPILFVVYLVSTRLWTGRFQVVGLGRPPSWTRTILIAVGAAALRIVLSDYVIEYITNRFWPPPVAPALAAGIKGDAQTALLVLLLVWTFAAFGEEISYRGYLLSRAAAALGGSSTALWIGVVFSAVLFGFGHYYKGPSGVVDSGVAGLILGAAYMLSGRNLWAAVLAHGLIDTVGVVSLYFGWAS